MTAAASTSLSEISQFSLEELRKQIARLPLTMRPVLNQQIHIWKDLFPFEQRRTSNFLSALATFKPDQLDGLTRQLRGIEQQMQIARSGFSITSDTMTNASQLARSPYYAEWRREVQRVFSAIESRVPSDDDPAANASRLIMLILPDTLPIVSLAGNKPWDARGKEYSIDGDTSLISDFASRLPRIVAAQSSSPPEKTAADCWLIDADAHLGALLGPGGATPASLLPYSVLKPFKDQFLEQVNAVPKDIEGTDQVLASMRSHDWSAWWPASMRGEDRLKSFVIELFLSGNGALIFPNAFVQWAASEAIRRARPRLLIARFGMRSKPKPFTGIAIFENQQKVSAVSDVDDPEGSAIDALILARYVWLSAQRYPEAQQTSCICVSESARSVYIIAPDPKRPVWPTGTAIAPEQIQRWMISCLA